MTKRGTRMLGVLGVAAIIGFAAGSGALAQDLKKTHIKTIGSATYLYQYRAAELPFWGKTIPEKSGGMVTAELLPYDTVGLKGNEILRLLKIGAFEFANGGLIIVARDDPALEGADLAGTVLTADTLHKTLDAYRPVIERVMREKWNSKLLLLGPNPPQVFWCNRKISGVADFKGLKIRVFGTTLADFVKGAGATAVTMPSSQVVQAMQRNLIDCAVTGTSNGNSAKWPEVTSHLYPAYAGWAPQFWAANLDAWNRLDPKVQAFLTEQLKDLEKEIWRIGTLGAEQGVNCSVGQGECTMPGLTKYKMTLVPISKKDEAAIRDIVSNHVVPAWAKRCGKACVEEWNRTIGAVIGVKAPM